MLKASTNQELCLVRQDAHKSDDDCRSDYCVDDDVEQKLNKDVVGCPCPQLACNDDSNDAEQARAESVKESFLGLEIGDDRQESFVVRASLSGVVVVAARSTLILLVVTLELEPALVLSM